MKIETSRLCLRPYTPADAPALHAAKMASQPQLRPWMIWAQRDSTVEDEIATITMFTDKLAHGTDYTLGIFTHGGEFIGSSGFRPHDDFEYFEIGYWLDTRHTGKGYAIEAVQAQTTFLLQHMNARRIEIVCAGRNIASANVALKAGFTQEARLHNHRKNLDGTIDDTLIFTWPSCA